MRTYVCVDCEREWEEIAAKDEPLPSHCGKPVRLKIVAPHVRYMSPVFNFGLGKKIGSFEQMERELKKSGGFIPTANDLSAAANHSIEDEQKAASEARKPGIKAVVEKTWAHLHNEKKV